MANDLTTNPRLWVLDTAGALKAAGNFVGVKGLHYEPAAVGNVVSIGEYAPDGSTRQQVIRRKAGAAAADPVDATFDPPIVLNGAYLETITAGTLYLEIADVNPKS